MKKKSWKPFSTPYTREERERVATTTGYKNEADFVRKRYNSVRTQIGLATPSYDASGPILNASVIRSVFPDWQEFKAGGGKSSFQTMNDTRKLLGLDPMPKECVCNEKTSRKYDAII